MYGILTCASMHLDNLVVSELQTHRLDRTSRPKAQSLLNDHFVHALTSGIAEAMLMQVEPLFRQLVSLSAPTIDAVPLREDGHCYRYQPGRKARGHY